MKKALGSVALALALGLPLGLLQGCAHTLDKKIDQEMAQETDVNTRKELRAETGQIIQTAPGLTADQRARLTALRESTGAQVDQLRTESLKLRSVLVKDLITTQYNEDEVELIKKRIKAVEDKRLAVTFAAIEQANDILGHEAIENRPVIEDFWEGRGSGRP